MEQNRIRYEKVVINHGIGGGEKGIKSIDTNLEKKTVTIQFDADKTSVDDIKEGFKKIKYEAQEIKPEASKEKE